jgi:hypothetical protein
MAFLSCQLTVIIEDYSGGRTAGDMVDFINKKAGTNARVKQAASAVVQLDASNFDQIVGKDKDVLIEFYAPCTLRFIHSLHCYHHINVVDVTHV